ncbi:GNAT family protein [uncultured Psychrosphaera sp.]|uniref:GNAT family N-acetyltransferase n=1 Tax=uncultured Psychrosphaera sp. TaxID=1403522 RepID=UPI0026045522|nr:GNAT family protein [uncultured Psychrosphaera sp.]
MISLRQFQTSDAELLVSYLNTPEVTQYITASIPTPYTNTDALWWIEHANQSEYIQAIEYKGEFIGCISATVGQFEYANSAELGYWIGKAFWNLGITTEAVKQFVELLFGTNKLNRLFVSVVAKNIASIRVLEKNGFVYEGTLKHASHKNGQYFDECLMAKLLK